MVNLGSNCINPKQRTKVKRAFKVKTAIEILAGIKLHKYKSLKPIKGAIRIIINK